MPRLGCLIHEAPFPVEACEGGEGVRGEKVPSVAPWDACRASCVGEGSDPVEVEAGGVRGEGGGREGTSPWPRGGGEEGACEGVRVGGGDRGRVEGGGRMGAEPGRAWRQTAAAAAS